MAANGISTLSTKQLRQVAKLDLAQLKRQGTFTRPNNGSVLLDGTQCLTVPANSEYTLGTNDHTIEFWLYQSGRGLYDIAWNYSQQGAYSTSAYYLNVGSAGVALLLGTGTEWGVFINPPSPSLDAWHHYAIVRYGDVFTLYVDGVGYSNTYAADIPAQPGVMSMGGMPGGDSVPGYFSNFRFVNGTAIYKEDFTPSEATLPNVPNTKILLNTVYGSNFLVDSSSIGATVTNVGNAVSSPQYPNAVVTVDTTAPFYRARNTYDITQLPTTYKTGDNDTEDVVDNPNLAELTLNLGPGGTGVKKVTYAGYHTDNVAFTDSATVIDTTTATNFTIASIAETTTVLYTGYFLADYTGTWTFTITSDDASYLWIGSTAVTGYTTSNELATASYSGPGTGTISLTAGEYYPIRLLYGNGPSTGSLNLTYAHTGTTATNNFTGKLFSPGVKLVYGRPWVTSEVYTGLTFTYGEATISFTLTNGTFSNVTCPYGAGGYSASSGQLTMLGNQLIGGTSPANDILWNYVCAANDGVITGFTYSSGTPP
jgi:hypothetical protein